MFKMKNKNSIYFLILIILLFAIVFTSYQFSSIKDSSNFKNDTIFNCTKIQFPINNKDSSQIGFFSAEIGVDISVAAICINDSSLYLLDDFHGNIKKFDFKTGKLTFSKRLTNLNNRIQLTDINVRGDCIYVSTKGNIVCVLDKDFSNDFYFRLPTIRKYPVYFLESTEEYIEVYMMYIDSSYTINKSNQIIQSRKLSESEVVRSKYKFDLNKGIVGNKSINYSKVKGNEYISIGEKTIRLITPFVYCSDVINLDFNNDFLVIYNVDSVGFTLYIYNLN